MNTIKNFTTIHLWLNQIDLLEFVIFCFPNKTEDLNLDVFNIITRINELKD